jgi:hypothetical protein
MNALDETTRPAPNPAPDPPPAEDRKIAETFHTSPQKTTHEQGERRADDHAPRARFDVQLDRYEAKYVIPSRLVPRIREFIRPFCMPDPNTHGDPPEYVITTLQLDTPDLALHRAKMNEAKNRFKLRVRTYGEPGESAVYLEVKRKIRGTIVKSRAKVPFDRWSERVVRDTRVNLTFKSREEENGYLNFVRLVRETGARPVVLVRYNRESYFGKYDTYARVTFDRRLLYQRTSSWDSWGRNGRWLAMDTPLAQNHGNRYSGVVLEIKTLSDAPHWMMDLIQHFNLERSGHCKYSIAFWLESLFGGEGDAPFIAEDLLFP